MQNLCRSPDPNFLFFKRLSFGSIDITLQRSLGADENPLAVSQSIQNSLVSGESGLTILKSGVTSNSAPVDTSRNAK